MRSNLPDIEEVPLFIAQVDATQLEDSGDFYYRTYAPGVGMAHCEGVYTMCCTNLHRLKFEIMHQADVLIINNFCDVDILPVIRHRKATGKLTVYELADDISDIPPAYDQLRDLYRESKTLLLIKRLANYCDALQFSSHGLQRKFGYLNGVTAVFPNNILDIPPERETKSPERVTVGWGGSIGHLNDMERISNPLIDWIMSRDDVNLHLMCSDEIWTLFDRLPRERILRSATGDIHDYYRFVSQLDIGLAPIEDTDFNRSRSDVKFLEYAANSVAPVIQAAGPYLEFARHGKTAYMFKTTEEMISMLDRLTTDHSARSDLAAAARKYVLEERNQTERGRDRVQFYRSLLKRTGWKPDPNCSSAVNSFERFSHCAGARQTGRNFFLSRTRFELLLTGGLIAMGIDKSRARELIGEAIQINPSSYSPYLMGAHIFDDKIGFLKNAVDKNPRSIAAWFYLGTAYAKENMRVEAIEAFNTAARIFPWYEQPYIQCANYLNSIGMTQEGIELLKKAKAMIPDALRDPQWQKGNGNGTVQKIDTTGLDIK